MTNILFSVQLCRSSINPHSFLMAVTAMFTPQSRGYDHFPLEEGLWMLQCPVWQYV